MPVRKYKPTSAGRRQSSVADFSEITKQRPEKSLVLIKKVTAGRNNYGHITVRHHGGGNKRFIRLVDFKRNRYDVPAKVTAIEYDPNRGSRLALVEYTDGVKGYMIQPQGMVVGDVIMSSNKKIEAKSGNRMPIEHIPAGMFVHDVELVPGAGGKMVRGAGTGAQLMSLEGEYALLRMPSTEMRYVLKSCAATVGMVGNTDHSLIRWGKAGRSRYRGIRPTVRGKVMNPVDHPHGGGEGRNSIGLKHPKTPWGKPALGVKTRNRKAQSNKFIVERRKNKRKKK